MDNLTSSLPVSTRKPTKSLECAVLNIDVRGATKLSSRSSQDSQAEAERLFALLELFSEVTTARDCDPDFLKSTGDGIMCVWHLPKKSKRSTLKKVAELALELNATLSQSLFNYLEDTPLPLGLGLAHGYVAEGEVSGRTDYFGHTANLAAKLQDSARPSGLVIHGEYIKALDDSSFTSSNALTQHVVHATSQLADFDVKTCCSTGNVRWHDDWTCLAWSGFATASPESAGNSALNDDPGLNTKGLTVLTHQGLQGKLGTLKIWPRFAPRSDGDCFELIIDDFDSLAMMKRQKDLQLMDRPEGHQVYDDAMDKILPEMQAIEGKEDFAFIPVRCGINALLSNSRCPSLANIASYRDIKNLFGVSGGGRTRLSPGWIGLYDNMGASLPLLMMMMSEPDDELHLRNIYDYQWRGATHGQSNDQRAIDVFCTRLQSLTNKWGERFVLYPTAEGLAKALRRERISLAIGGGKWLESPGGLSQHIFSLPTLDGGLLWVEGAAITKDNNGDVCTRIIRFLSENVLSDKYQSTLGTRLPYASSPVTRTAINEAFPPTKRSPLPIDEETKLIYPTQTGTDLPEYLTHRRCPKDLSEWLFAWNHIRSVCCKHPDA